MKFVHDRIKKAHTHTSNCSQASFTYIDTLVKQKIWPIIKNVCMCLASGFRASSLCMCMCMCKHWISNCMQMQCSLHKCYIMIFGRIFFSSNVRSQWNFYLASLSRMTDTVSMLLIVSHIFHAHYPYLEEAIQIIWLNTIIAISTLAFYYFYQK